jgi:hypothetical protein
MKLALSNEKVPSKGNLSILSIPPDQVTVEGYSRISKDQILTSKFSESQESQVSNKVNKKCLDKNFFI